MKPSSLILISSLLFFLACKSTKPLQGNQQLELRKKIDLFIHSFNNQDKKALLDIFHKDYQSFCPINKPDNISSFIESNLKNLVKNNFEIVVQIKEIESGLDQAFVSMNWQLKTRGAAKENDPFANVQRLDIWKLDSSNDWRLFRTVIYNEKAF